MSRTSSREKEMAMNKNSQTFRRVVGASAAALVLGMGAVGCSGSKTPEQEVVSSGERAIPRPIAAYHSPFVTEPRYSFNDCVVVTRVSDFNNVYATIYAQKSSGGVWVPVVARTDLHKNDPLTGCSPGSYQMKAVVERRKSNDYTFTSH